MAENNQLSDETKINSTNTSSTDVSSAVIGNHENAIVPHKISNHDKLVQTMVMVDGEWINVNDTNDQANVKYDMHKVNKKVVEAQKGIVEAKNSAESAVKYADSAVSASKVNSDAIAAQSSAIIEAKSAMDSATAEIQQLKANAASDVAQIRADVAQVQNEVDTAKAANSASVDKLKSDIGLAQKDLDNVHDSLTKAQSAVEQNQKLINDSVTKINSDIAQSRQDIITAQQANNDLTKQLDTYSKEAQEQGKTIKTIQDNQDGFSITIADVKGDVTKVSDTVDRLSAGLKDAQGNIANVKAQADQLNVTLTDHSKNINQLIATAKELSSTLKDADGRLSKVEQTAKEHSSTLSDLQGNLSQVKQTATDLVTTLKDAQGNIDQIKQDAKGTSEQLSNAQGDITALQKDVGGIKLTIADHDKSIHTLQADSKSLKDSMTNAQGDISTLKKTSTDVVSELKDHAGRISKAEQTASTLVNELADQQGHLNRVEQTAQGTEQTVANQQGQIDDIKTDAAGMHQTITGQGNQIANINVTLNGLNTKYEGVSGDLGKLKDQVTTNSTQITQNKQAIALKADQSTVSNLSGEVSQAQAQLKVQADQISSKVSSTDFQTLNGSAMQNRGTVDSPDFNSLTQAGFYTITNPSGGKNYPTGSWGTLEVSGQVTDANGRLNQKYVSDNGGITYTRQYNAGAKSWTSWAKVANQNDIDTLNGEITKNITAIQKNATAIDQTNKQISLKADQTEVNQIKNTASQNSSRLDVMAGEIKSKVTSTDVNSIVDKKGYATTSTVQSLITQKAGTINESITNLTSKVNSNNGGGINLLQGTAKIEFPLRSNGGTQTIQKYDDETNYIQHTSNTPIYTMGPWWPLTLKVGQIYTLSADVCGNGYIPGGMFHYEGADEGSLGRVDLTNDWQRISNTFRVNTISGNWVIYANNSTLLKVKHIKIERGSVATPWTPAPSDIATVTQVQQITASIDGLQSIVANKADKSQITQLSNVIQSKVSSTDFNNLRKAVDLQTLESADANNLKTNGHYFVHNLANNPVGGWVYVDVTGNGADRIRQDVYQDNGNQHKYRRWFGDSWTAWSQGATESEITQLRDDINLRVKSGDLLSQINIEAGRTLIQSNKIYFDADSFVMSPNSKAFIPSAYITNINADKITTGTLDVAKFNVKNFSADNIVGGTLNGVVVKTGANDRYFQTSKDNIYWVRKGSMSLVGNDTYLNRANGLNIADMNNIQLTTWGGASVNPDGSIVNTSGDAGHPKIVVDTNGNWDPDDPYGTKWGGGPGNSEIVQWIGNKEYTALTRGKGLTVRLNDENKNSVFVIQKDNKVGFYVGGGDDGGEIRIAGAGPIKLQGKYLDDGFNDGMTHTLGNLQVNNLRVRKWLGVDQSKNAIVKTSQGPVTINAYETAEYYFGDIGEGQTSADGIAYIGIEKLFNETVNTTIPYHVFITAYGPGNIWVDQREHNRFIVKSDQPNLKFSWEIKAKRKGYEQTRLQNVNDKLNHMAATS